MHNKTIKCDEKTTYLDAANDAALLISIVYEVSRPLSNDLKAAGKGPQPYLALSHAYQERTGDWFEPHGSWDKPLGKLNNRLAVARAPALSALVILKEENEPGGKFWGCAPNVPNRPSNEMDRITE